MDTRRFDGTCMMTGCVSRKKDIAYLQLVNVLYPAKRTLTTVLYSVMVKLRSSMMPASFAAAMFWRSR